MKEQRAERVAELIKREISVILLYRVGDPRLKRFTITQVKVSPDLRQAKVFIYFPGTEKKEKYQALQKATGFIKNELALRLRIKFMPEIIFVMDETMDKAFQVVELLNQMEREEDGRETGDN
ncbi:MAG TPA: 30S ribosome-binding factor RbfA [Candidatus Atribacteria bacterium]|nr:30S ribosome-binding factor RbfA [Candidatus Atribacteria bacterium]HPU08122.1 30S ribosome-binding factor RbfA [Candidatus Atribacteria bacterium]HQE24441.1 30S ribosome-binding factor RbfA [Candidatus Atribacteria bacterium]